MDPPVEFNPRLGYRGMNQCRIQDRAGSRNDAKKPRSLLVCCPTSQDLGGEHHLPRVIALLARVE